MNKRDIERVMDSIETIVQQIDARDTVNTVENAARRAVIYACAANIYRIMELEFNRADDLEDAWKWDNKLAVFELTHEDLQPTLHADIPPSRVRTWWVIGSEK